MPFLPLQEKPFKNVESLANQRAIDNFIDFSKDDYGNNVSRLGLGGSSSNAFSNIVNTSAGDVRIHGLFYARNANLVAAFSGGSLFKVEEDGTSTLISGATINYSTPVKFADFGTVGYFCNNSQILEWTYANSTCALLADAQAPTDATHLGFLDSYLLALKKDSQRFDWSEVDTPTSWVGEFASVEARPDYAVALEAAFGEIFFPGTATLEHWIPSGNPSAPFQRMPGSIIERGCIAPYSIVQADNGFFFFDEERKIIRLDGRTPKVISNPYDKEFQDLDIVTDAIGIHVNPEGKTFYVITFPDAHKTYAYDYKLDYWSEWSYWNTVSSLREAWLGNCGLYVDKWGKYLVGSRKGSQIYEMSKDYATDAGSTLLAEMWTGWIDWGTNRRKESNKLRLKLKRGVGDPFAIPKLFMSSRDDGNTEWKAERIIDLGQAGDTEFYVTFRRLGNYRTRQYRFRTEDGPLTLINAEEDFTVIP